MRPSSATKGSVSASSASAARPMERASCAWRGGNGTAPRSPPPPRMRVHEARWIGIHLGWETVRFPLSIPCLCLVYCRSLLTSYFALPRRFPFHEVRDWNSRRCTWYRSARLCPSRHALARNKPH